MCFPEKCCLCALSPLLLFPLSLAGTYVGFILNIVFYMDYRDGFMTGNIYHKDTTFAGLGFDGWLRGTFILGMIVFGWLICVTLLALCNQTRFDDWYLLGCCRVGYCRREFCINHSLCNIWYMSAAVSLTYVIFLWIGSGSIQTLETEKSRELLLAITIIQSISIPVGYISYLILPYSHPLTETAVPLSSV